MLNEFAYMNYDDFSWRAGEKSNLPTGYPITYRKAMELRSKINRDKVKDNVAIDFDYNNCKS